MKGSKHIEEVKAKFQAAEPATVPLQEPSPPSSSSTEFSNEKFCEKFEEKLRDSKMCKMCCINEYNTVFIPCGHIISCIQCSFALNNCPLCRQPINEVMEVYFT